MTCTLIPLEMLCLLTIFCLYGSLSYTSVNSKPFVVSELKQRTGKDGNFTPGISAKIVHTSVSSELLRIAQIFTDDHQQMFGETLSVTQGRTTPGDFVLSLSADKELGEEDYEIRITDRITTSAPTPAGLYWSTRTLLQMTKQSQEHSFPKGIIRDYPDYSTRRFIVDRGCKSIPMSYLQNPVKITAYCKMNILQAHLNDNGLKQCSDSNWDETYAAFRSESGTYPGLTVHDGSHPKREFIDFQKRAVTNFVGIIPEIDILAYSLAFTHYRPEIRSKKYGTDHLDSFKPETYQFANDLFKEYLKDGDPVFADRRMYTDTDEYSNAKKEVVERFRTFTDHYIRLMEGFGK